MTETLNGSPEFATKLGRLARGLIAAVLAIAFAALVFFLAAVLTAAAVAVVGVAMLVAGAWWLWRKVRGNSNDRDDGGDPTLLNAHLGPDGWTVDSAGRQ